MKNIFRGIIAFAFLIGLSSCEKVVQVDVPEGETLLVIYRGQVLDEDGLPALTAKEVEALAYYVAYLDVQKRIFMKEPGMADLFQIIKPEYIRTMTAAKIPEYVSQNFWDQLLSAHTRMDRKTFGNSYRLIR